MNKVRDQQIAARAYQLWEEEGRPHGAHDRHWEQASREIDAVAEAEPEPRAGARAPRRAPVKAEQSLEAGKAPAKSRTKPAIPARAAAAKVEGDAGDKRSKPAGGKARMR